MSVDWSGLRRLADEQADLLTRAQCLGAGLSEGCLSWRVTSRRWVWVHEGVFLTRPGRSDWLMRAMAALLYADTARPGADAACRGLSAAYLWGLGSDPPRTIELAVPVRRRVVAPSGVRIRRVEHWDDLVDEIACPWRTTVEATILDCAEEGDENHGTQSPAEIRYVRDVERAHALPAGVRQAASDAGTRGYHDNDYPQLGVIVEVDGRLGHQAWADRVRDGRRDRQVARTGRFTTRVFWPDVWVTPCDTAVELAALFRSRGWAGTPRRCRRRGCAVDRRR